METCKSAQDKDKKIDHLNQVNLNLSKTVADLNALLHAVHTELEGTKKNNQDKKKRIEELKVELNKTKTNVDELKNSLHNKTKRIENLIIKWL